MTEFLKNNPIALRHCLLYEFLQGKPVEEAFSGFCEAVGKYVIEKESFEFWFDKFFWGIFDDAIDPINDMRDIFRNDKQALRTCIIYESLKYKRLEKNINKRFLKSYQKLVYRFSAHRNFRKAIGDDVMEYREFDFLFHRFLNEEFDLNYERDEDKKFSELMEMPLDVMKNIVEYLDIFDRMSLAGTSRSLKTFVEDQKVFHPGLSLNVDDHATNISYGFEYRTKSYEHWTKSREKVWKEAIHDFKAVLSYPKLHLDTLNIKIHTDSPTLMEKMIDELVPTRQLHLQSFYISVYSTDSLLKILPLFTPGYLTTIDASVQKIDNTVMKKVAELEQWKQATHVSVNSNSGIRR